jgi:DNA repair protein RadC
MVEKFLSSAESFADHEILEVLLYSVIKRQDTNPLAHKILRYFNNLNDLFNAEVKTLMKIDGVGKKVAVYLKSIGLLYNRMKDEKKATVCRCDSLNTLKPVLLDYFGGSKTETFAILLFDKNKNHLSTFSLSSGEFDRIFINTSSVISDILVKAPKYVVLAHNHTSNIAEPSSSDDLSTIKFNMLLDLHGITLFDHVIVTENSFYSYFGSGRLNAIQKTGDLNKILQNITQNGEKL